MRIIIDIKSESMVLAIKKILETLLGVEAIPVRNFTLTQNIYPNTFVQQNIILQENDVNKLIEADSTGNFDEVNNELFRYRKTIDELGKNRSTISYASLSDPIIFLGRVKLYHDFREIPSNVGQTHSAFLSLHCSGRHQFPHQEKVFKLGNPHEFVIILGLYFLYL